MVMYMTKIDNKFKMMHPMTKARHEKIGINTFTQLVGDIN
jgi:hypothetical protein